MTNRQTESLYCVKNKLRIFSGANFRTTSKLQVPGG